VRCGRGHEHQTVAEVRACYAERDNGQYFSTEREETREVQRRDREETGRVAEWKMARDLAGMEAGASLREVKPVVIAGYDSRPADLRRPGAVDLEPGGYAVTSRTGNNDLDFYWLDSPEDGKWKGWTFPERVIGGRSNQRITREEQNGVLLLLVKLSKAHRQEAQERFGREIGRCYICGRHLTDEASRAAGIGPVCAAR
jgi:hypothetical protein